MSDYPVYTAGVCYNGHIVDMGYIHPSDEPDKFCKSCGKPVIFNCQHCRASIQVIEWNEYTKSLEHYPVPNYCRKCGQAHLWMEAKIKATQELADELKNLTSHEKEALKDTIPDLVSETPRTRIAAIKFKQLAAKAGTESLGMFKEILTDVLAETAKKMLLP